MMKQFDQYRFTSIGALSQFCNDRDHSIKGRVSLFVVAAFCATTMLSGFSNKTVFRVDHNSLHSH